MTDTELHETKADAYHDIDPFSTGSTGGVSARCLTHETVTSEQWATFRQAAHDFHCDPAEQRFITEYHDGDDVHPATMRDLSGLARVIRGDAEARVYSGADGSRAAWMWHSGGKLEPLTITLDHGVPFDEDDWGEQVWKVSGEDGREVLSVTVWIDGRA